MPDIKLRPPPLAERAAALPSAAPAPPRGRGGPGRGQGRRPFEPTAAQRQVVTVLRGTGFSVEEVALQLGVAPGTVRRAFREELASARLTLVGRIGAKCVQLALGGNTAMIALFLRCHGGDAWKDKQRHEHTGVDGTPLQPPALIVSFLEPKKPDAEGT